MIGYGRSDLGEKCLHNIDAVFNLNGMIRIPLASNLL